MVRRMPESVRFYGSKRSHGEKSNRAQEQPNILIGDRGSGILAADIDELFEREATMLWACSSNDSWAAGTAWMRYSTSPPTDLLTFNDGCEFEATGAPIVVLCTLTCEKARF